MGEGSKPPVVTARPAPGGGHPLRRGAALARFAIPLSIVALAFAVRAAGLDAQGLWRDEVDAVRFSGSPLPELLRTFLTPGQNGPLFYLLLRPWLAVAGDSEFALRFFSLFFGVLAVPFAARLAARLLPGGPWAAATAALLAAASPYLIWYGQEGKMYTLVVALVLASTGLYLAALRRGGWPMWLGYVVTTTASFYVHFIAALIIPVHVLIFVVGPWQRRARLKSWLLSLALLTLPYLPLLTWQIPALVEKVETGYRSYPLGEMVMALWADYSLGVGPGGGLWPLVLFAGLGAAGLVAGALRSGGRRSGIWIAVVWLIVPILGFYLITLRRPMFTTRYLIWILPAYLLLLAGGLMAAGRLWRPLAPLLLAAVIALNGWNTWSQAHTQVKTDYRSATYYVLERMAAGDLVLFQIPYGRYSFDYYVGRWTALYPGRPAPRPSTATSGAYRWAEGPYTNSGMTPEEAARSMAGATAGSRVIWLLESEASMWDERGLTEQWLHSHATLLGSAAFNRVTVYHYVVSP